MGEEEDSTCRGGGDGGVDGDGARGKEGCNKRADGAARLSKYFYDVAAFRSSLVKKGFPFVGRHTIAEYSPYDPISSFRPSKLFFFHIHPTTWPLTSYSKTRQIL